MSCGALSKSSCLPIPQGVSDSTLVNPGIARRDSSFIREWTLEATTSGTFTPTQKWDIYNRRRHHDESGAHTLNGSDHATRILIELSDLATYIGHL